MRTHEASIRGMHCGGCATRIRDAVETLPGVRSVRVDPEAGSAVIVADDALERDAVDRAVAGAGAYAITELREVDEPREPSAAGDQAAAAEPAESLYPLFLIVGYIAGATVLIAGATGAWSIEAMMRHFMAGFFLVFSFFKLLDLRGFASAYRRYDIPATYVPAWAYAYPFVELGLGIAYLLAFAPVATNIATLVLMLVGAAGVLRALRGGRRIRCACLGTALNLPMTTVTLIEDLTMAAMAAAMLALA
ncbi:MAG: MauE/DoxX family redox-associated membrane protein [Planctomycetota bacterium]